MTLLLILLLLLLLMFMLSGERCVVYSWDCAREIDHPHSCLCGRCYSRCCSRCWQENVYDLKLAFDSVVAPANPKRAPVGKLYGAVEAFGVSVGCVDVDWTHAPASL